MEPSEPLDPSHSQHPLKADFWTTRRIAGLLGIAVLLWGLVRFSDLTAYLIISIALSFMGRPLVQLVDRIHIGRWSPGPGLGALMALTTLFA